MQCTEFNTKDVMEDGLHTWKPFVEKNDAPCVLYCINEKNTYVKLAPAVKDGTPCEAGTKNMCIGGVCRVKIYFYLLYDNKSNLPAIFEVLIIF